MSPYRVYSVLSPSNDFQQGFLDFVLYKRARKRRDWFFGAVGLVFGVFCMIVMISFMQTTNTDSSSSQSDGMMSILMAPFEILEDIFDFFFQLFILAVVIGVAAIFVGFVVAIVAATKRKSKLRPIPMQNPVHFISDLHFLIHLEKNRVLTDGNETKNGIFRLLAKEVNSKEKAHAIVLNYRNTFNKELMYELQVLTKKVILKKQYLQQFIQYGVCHPDLFYYIEKKE